MKTRNLTIYVAQFSQLKLSAFGIDNVIDYTASIEIYQARVSPELWRARPMFNRGGHKWEAASAEALQQLVARDFLHCLAPWKEYPAPPRKDARPSLRKEPQDEAQSA